jgi:hypothetical protein
MSVKAVDAIRIHLAGDPPSMAEIETGKGQVGHTRPIEAMDAAENRKQATARSWSRRHR